MNVILLAFLAVGEILLAGLLVYESYCLLRWLDRRVFTPLYWKKINDLVLRLYARQATEEWLFWERRREEANGAGHEPAGEAIEPARQGPGSGDDPAPGS